MNNNTRIVIADDHSMFREGIHMLLEKENELEIVGEARDGNHLLQITRSLVPDIVITDIEMPNMNGIEATKKIKEEFPGTGIIALTMYGDDHLIVDMLEAGATGYLLKNARKEELAEAVRAVHSGQSYYCNSTSMRLTKMIAKSKAIKDEAKIEFNEKELEIMKLICEQYASKEIAEATQLTHRTVEKYRGDIMEKIKAKNMAGVVVYAIRKGIYKP
jgi:DNA-binding NarL/FixJ family response regulator